MYSQKTAQCLVIVVFLNIVMPILAYSQSKETTKSLATPEKANSNFGTFISGELEKLKQSNANKQTPKPIEHEDDWNNYVQNVQKEIYSHWNPPKNLETYCTVVIFQITKEGSIRDIKIEKSSGNSYFDQVCLETLYKTRKLNQLPKWSTDASVHIEFSFSYNDARLKANNQTIEKLNKKIDDCKAKGIANSELELIYLYGTLAEDYYVLKQYEKSYQTCMANAKLISACTKMKPSSKTEDMTAALALEARNLQKMNRTDQAEKAYLEALNYCHDNPNSFYPAVIEYYAEFRGKSELKPEVVAEYKKAISIASGELAVDISMLSLLYGNWMDYCLSNYKTSDEQISFQINTYKNKIRTLSSISYGSGNTNIDTINRCLLKDLLKLAYLQLSIKDYPGAKESYSKALSLANKNLSLVSAITINDIRNLAWKSYDKQKQYELSAQLYLDLDELDKKKHLRLPNEICADMIMLGNSYAKSSKWKEAMPVFEDAINLKGQYEIDRYFCTSVKSIYNLYKTHLGEEAAIAYQKRLESYFNDIEAGKHNCCNLSREASWYYYDQNKLEVAESILTKQLNESTTSTIASERERWNEFAQLLAGLYLEQNKFEAAVNIYKNRIDTLSQTSNSDSTNLITCWNNLGIIYLEMKDWQNAKLCFLEGQKICDPKVQFSQLSTLFYNQAILLIKQEKFDDLDKLCKDWIDMADLNHGAGSIERLNTLGEVTTLYEILNKPEQVDSYSQSFIKGYSLICKGESMRSVKSTHLAWLATQYYLHKDYEKSKQCYSTLTDSRAGNDLIQLAATAYLSEDKTASSIEIEKKFNNLTKQVNVFSTNVDTVKLISNSLIAHYDFNKGNYKNANTTITSYLSSPQLGKSKYAIVLNSNLASINIAEANNSEAIKNLTAIANFDPNSSADQENFIINPINNYDNSYLTQINENQIAGSPLRFPIYTKFIRAFLPYFYFKEENCSLYSNWDYALPSILIINTRASKIDAKIRLCKLYLKQNQNTEASKAFSEVLDLLEQSINLKLVLLFGDFEHTFEKGRLNELQKLSTEISPAVVEQERISKLMDLVNQAPCHITKCTPHR